MALHVVVCAWQLVYWWMGNDDLVFKKVKLVKSLKFGVAYPLCDPLNFSGFCGQGMPLWGGGALWCGYFIVPGRRVNLVKFDLSETAL